jgi:hypothetical protein
MSADFISTKGQTVTETPIRPAPDWQDISTAPRDGTVVILFAAGVVCVGRYDGPSDGAVIAGTPSQYEWFDLSEMRSLHNSGVTHWMPLPAPPKEVG